MISIRRIQTAATQEPFGQVIRMTAEKGNMLRGMLLSALGRWTFFAEKYAATGMLPCHCNGMLIRASDAISGCSWKAYSLFSIHHHQIISNVRKIHDLNILLPKYVIKLNFVQSLVELSILLR